MRGGLPIQRNSEAGYEVEKADKLPEALKSAVTSLEQSRQRKSFSIIDQINGIMGGKPRYGSVADAVADMRERTGLNQYLDQVKSSSMTQKSAKSIVAQIMNSVPESLNKYKNVADILSYVDNVIEGSHGLGCSIPQLQDDILRTFPKVQPEDVMTDSVAKYLNSKIISAISLMGPGQENNPNLGKGLNKEKFEENENAWQGLEPNKD